MNPWDPITYTVTPAAKILARCVTSGTMTQEELDAVPRESEVFSSSLLEAEQLSRIRHDLDQTNLDLELLRLERDGADVTHSHYLSQRFASLQQFTSHLQEVLREQTVLRERLTKPLCQQNLPIPADLHRYVVELMGMVVEFIQNLEVKIKMVRAIPNTESYLSNLNNGRTQLLAQVTEVENLYKQVLKRRGHSQTRLFDKDFQNENHSLFVQDTSGQ
ncbi:HAUS augmin-like complex subunit 2 [Ctenopharyngodon idella]|uniref:HAUS augmin-like complex subunit 2 n=1 Tax=Ctenopharyngodon idella TaxID=7959 RepID=UPI002230034D|nr:HAUS augmin-like complex subunit 2 [Ctenopharyngodon idella]XP_051723554.1 HAUS augmin-like complex subunit 2 [Ctenopharyngodon idella]XP_051723555.1 HAUS augmin-like complex subunit 2 [Ctenopharyngodon idella]XP_051723556.1 HAUS augmin-like complex subunit 2 [Ctenopharyngodon idella]XP_051723557.1 HAUS augmin-like complex subunit 2 [Ctenopharyngodon idella]